MTFSVALAPATISNDRGSQPRAPGRSVRAPAPSSTVRLFGLPIVRSTLEAISDELLAGSDRQRRVAFVNAHCVNTMRRDAVYRDALETADLLLPDGSGLAIAGRALAGAKLTNLNGTDLFPVLCAKAAAAGQSVYLLGAKPGVAAAAADAAVCRFPALRIAGVRDGYFDRNDEQAVIDDINDSGADILLVAMGVPMQEVWLSRNQARLKPRLLLGVGGLFDFVSGRIPRAPRWLRRVGCEWIWRLAQEPRRLANRYLAGNVSFLGDVLRCWIADRRREAERHALPRWRRMLDVSVSVSALLLLSPLLATVAAAIKLESRGPIFFRQQRVGEDGRLFEMLKFRSMYVDAEARREALLAESDRQGLTFKMKQDPRITRVGRLIRRLSIDELPQIINIMRGDMALVGPRPALPSEVSGYSEHERMRLRGKPGLTGLWQIAGRADVGFSGQVAMDIAYLKSRSLVVDALILLLTAPAVLSGRGAY